MSPVFTGNAVWHLIMQSDAICQGVLLLLLLLSLISWSLFFYRLIIMRTKHKELTLVSKQLERVQSFDELFALAYRTSDSFGGYFLNKNLFYLKSALETVKNQGRTALNSEERELLREHSYQMIDEIVYSEEQSLPFLSATAAVSPLLGLFGTVWGLVHAFINISQKQSADIATVAPGIAEALITTLAGLVVAIPALVMFVYLNTKLKSLEQQLIRMTDTFITSTHSLMHK